MELKFVIGLVNEAGEEETVQVDSFVLLCALHAALKTNGFVFEVLSNTDPEEVKPSEYEDACKELGMMFGFVENALFSEKAEERKEQLKKLH